MTDIDKLSDRPNEYLSETGVPQLVSGLVFVLLGSAVVIQGILPKTFVAQEAPKWAAILCCLAVWRLAKLVKRRVVFPRGGYVEPLPGGDSLTRTHTRDRWQWIGLIVLAIVLGIGIAVPMYWRLLDSSLIWPAFALSFSAISLVSGARQKSTVMVCFGIYMACLAPVLWWLPANNYQRGAWLQTAAGLPLAIYGAVRLRKFVKANPLSAGTDL